MTDETSQVDESAVSPQVAPQQPVPAYVAVPPATKSRASTVLGVVAIVEGIIIVLLLVVIGFGFSAYFGPYGPGIMPWGMGGDWAEEERVWMLSEDLGYDISIYLQDGDLEEYLTLYDANDSSVDFDAVAEDFNAASEKAQAEEVDVYAGMTELFEDTSTGEMVARVDFELSDWDSGRTVGRIRTYMTVPDEDSSEEPMLTGKVGRDLERVGTPY